MQQLQIRKSDRNRIDFESINHEGEKGLPGIEKEVSSYRAQIIEKGDAFDELIANEPIVNMGKIERSMGQKCEQIEGKKRGRQMVVTMTKVMFQMVALIFEHIDGFIFDFPTCATKMTSV